MKVKVKKFGTGGAHIVVPARFIGQMLEIPLDEEKSELELMWSAINAVKEDTKKLRAEFESYIKTE